VAHARRARLQHAGRGVDAARRVAHALDELGEHLAREVGFGSRPIRSRIAQAARSNQRQQNKFEQVKICTAAKMNIKRPPTAIAAASHIIGVGAWYFCVRPVGKPPA